MKTLTSICMLTIAALATFNTSGAVWDTSISNTQIPTVTLSKKTMWFWYYPRCILNQPETVVLTNDGPGLLDIRGIATTNKNFSQTHTCGSALGVGDSCSITVTWDRNQAVGSLIITDNGVGSPQSVRLVGYDACPK